MDTAADENRQMAETRYRTLFEHAPVGILIADAESRYLDANPSMCAMLGYTRDELVGLHAADIVARSEIRHIDPALDDIKTTSCYSREWQFRRKDGSLFSAEVTATTMPDGNLLGMVRDITLLRTHEREIIRISRLYAALSQVNQAIVRTRTRDELFGQACRVLIEHGGFGLAWIGWHDPETHLLAPVAVWGDEAGYIRNIKVYADDRPEGRGPSGLSFRSGRPYICNDISGDPVTLPWRAEIERRGFRASAVFPIRENGQVGGTLSVYAYQQDFFQDMEIALLEEAAGDVSYALDSLAREEQRRQAEIAAQDEKHFSDTMIESMPGILYFYNEQGQFLRWNRNFETVSGYTGAEIARMHPLDFFSSREKEPLAQRIAEVFETGESSIEASLVSRDGSATPYFFTGRRVMFEGMPCLVDMGIDISERKQAEAALRELNETLEHKVAERTTELQSALVRAEAADRIKSAFLATMSHELRTPLNSIIGFTGILLQGMAGPLNAEQSKQLGMVQGSARHLLELINDVLDISKIEASQLEVRAEPFDLHASLDRVIATVRPLAEKKGITLDAVISPALGAMLSDRRRVEQILINLLNNAIKFTDHGGVTLTAEAVTDFRARPDAAPRPAARLRVSDTGIGIKPADLDTLFQPFRQLDSGLARQHEGTGLGLAICRRLTALLEGEICVSSVRSKGSEFTVTIPLQLSSRP